MTNGFTKSCIFGNRYPIAVDRRGEIRPADGDGEGKSRSNIGAYQLQPTQSKQVNPQVKLDRDDTKCATFYHMPMKLGSKKVPNAYTNTVIASKVKLTPLISGQLHNWRINAVNIADKKVRLAK